VDLVLKLAGNTGSGRGRDCCSVRSRGAVAMSPKSPMWMPVYEECIESKKGVKEVVSNFSKIGSIRYIRYRRFYFLSEHPMLTLAFLGEAR